MSRAHQGEPYSGQHAPCRCSCSLAPSAHIGDLAGARISASRTDHDLPREIPAWSIVKHEDGEGVDSFEYDLDEGIPWY